MYQKAIIVVAFFVQWPLLLNPASVFMSEWVQSCYYTELLGFSDVYDTLFSPNILLVVSIILDWAGGSGFQFLAGEVLFKPLVQ